MYDSHCTRCPRAGPQHNAGLADSVPPSPRGTIGLPERFCVPAQAGAFALNAGGKDAAVIVTLPAGASYTAVVSGVNGATGEALVEIYDLQ